MPWTNILILCKCLLLTNHLCLLAQLPSCTCHILFGVDIEALDPDSEYSAPPVGEPDGIPRLATASESEDSRSMCVPSSPP